MAGAVWLALACALAGTVAGGCDIVLPVIERLPAGSSDGDATTSASLVDGDATSDTGPADGDAEASSGPADGDAAIPTDPADGDAQTPADGDAASGPFGTPSLVTAVSDPRSDNEDPSLSADELELYFMSTRSGNNDIWVSRRATINDVWGTPQVVAEISTTAGEAEPFISTDALTLWFTTNRDADAGAGYHIWVATRATRTTPFGAPQAVSELWSPGMDGKPSVDQTQLIMAFMSDRAGGAGGVDIYLSRRATPVDPWGVAVNVAEVNTTDDERDPFLGAQSLQLFWADNGPNEEIRGSTRSSTAQAFSAYQVLGELGTPDFDETFSPDLRHVLFARGAAGAQEIYEAFR